MWGEHPYVPAVWGPEPRAWSLCTEQLHGRDGVVEEVAEAKHGTNQNTRRSSAVLNTQDEENDECIYSNSIHSVFKRKLYLGENKFSESYMRR